jgi:hypothetical protein
VPETLEREGGRGVADVAVCDERLDGQEAHLLILAASSPAPVGPWA